METTDQQPPPPAKESHSHHDFSPLSWELFFSERKTLEIDGNQFNVYLKGSSGPLFLLLHGGGYTGLSWACFAVSLFV